MRTALILRAVNMLGLPMVNVEKNYELDRLTLTLWTRCSASISLPPCYSTPHAGDNAETTGDNAESIGDNAESIGDNTKVSPNGAEVRLNGAEVRLNGAEVSPNGAEVSPNGAEVSPNGVEASLNSAEENANGAENTSLNKQYISKYLNRRKQDSNNLMLQTLKESYELTAREISFEINLSLRRIRELLSESVKLGKIVTYGSNEKRNTCFPDSLSLYNAWKQYECYQVATLPHPILYISVNEDSYEIPSQERCYLRRKEEWQR